MHSGENRDRHATDTQNSVTQRLRFQLNKDRENSVTIALEYSFSGDITDFSVAIPNTLSCTDLNGFSHDAGTCVWDGHTQSAKIQGSLQIEDQGSEEYKYIDAGDWAIIQRPPLSISVKYRGPEPTINREYETAGKGATSSDGCVVYLGPYEEHDHYSGTQRFRLIVPSAASLQEPATEILDTLSEASTQLDVGGRNPTVVAITAPTGVGWGSLGVQSGANGFWAQDSCSLQAPNNTWIHEYVHTRQEWDPSASAKWLLEATAEYYAALITYKMDLIPFSTFYNYLSTTRDPDAILVDPTNWTSPNPSYTKGRRVLAALDLELRQQTNGTASFQDVFRQLNTRNEPVSHGTLTEIVSTIAGEPLENWLDRYVCDTAVPPLPDEPTAYVSQPDTPTEEPDTDPTHPPESGPDAEPDPDSDEPACPVCNATVPPDAQFCGSCGHSLHEPCPVCGTNVDGAAFCPECGSDLLEECGICQTTRVGSEPFCRKCGNAFN